MDDIGPRPGGDESVASATLELLEADDLRSLLSSTLQLVRRCSGAREVYVEVLSDDGLAEVSETASEGCSPDRVNEIRHAVSRGIIAEAIATGRTVDTLNAQVDPRFLTRESVRRNEIEAVLCVPIGRDSPRGVIYIQGTARESASGIMQPLVRGEVERIASVLALSVERLLGARSRQPRSDPGPGDAFAGIIRHGSALKEVIAKLRFAGPLDLHVLFTGASGVGKTQLARATHTASKRRNAPFAELNCASLPEALFENELFGADPGAHSAVPRGGLQGKVEAAEGGTLFLDEIGELPLAAQAKLLQLMQSKVYYRLGSTKPRMADVRIMAATNVDLRQAIADSRFREDLYYRLRVLEVRVPSLSERPEDVAPLAWHFMRACVARHELSHKTLSPGAVRAIQVRDWAGNVRELAHQLDAAVQAAELRGSQRRAKTCFRGRTAPAVGSRGIRRARGAPDVAPSHPCLLARAHRASTHERRVERDRGRARARHLSRAPLRAHPLPGAQALAVTALPVAAPALAA